MDAVDGSRSDADFVVVLIEVLQGDHAGTSKVTLDGFGAF